MLSEAFRHPLQRENFMSEPSEVTMPASPRSFQERLMGSIMLDASVYEEVEHDETAMGQAATVVALGAIAAGIGASASGGLGGVIGMVLMSLIGWALGAAIVWLVGVQVMGHNSDMPQLLRSLGFASAPRLLLLLGIIPLLGMIVTFAVWIMSLVAWVLAVRQALDVDTGRAVLVCILAFIAQIAVGAILAFFGLGMVAATA